MGKFKEIDLFCKNDDREGLIDFLAEHGVQNPHKQANIYLEEYRMNKTVKISDINKEIAAEMQLQEMIDILSERISNLSKVTELLSERIDVVNKRISNLITEE
tara:strand:+ start:392 stop:700 length:309 start_codon:yes stop_codon:yes gene_type:complete